MAPIRLQKIIARAGIASRRGAEQLIAAGRVRVNGRIVNALGSVACPSADRVEVDGQGVLAAEPLAYILMHKPQYVVSTVDDPERRLSVVELLGQSRAIGPRQLEGGMPRVFPVGRLDFDAEGLILLTNDGPLTHAVLHPRHHVPKTYAVKVRGRPGPQELTRLREGVRLRREDGTFEPRPARCEVEVLKCGQSNTWLEMTLFEGRNHQIKRMCESIGHFCIRLVRTHFGGIALGELPPGGWRFLTAEELQGLRAWGPGTRRPAPRRRGAKTLAGAAAPA